MDTYSPSWLSFEFGIKIEFCPQNVDVSVAPPNKEDVYMHPQVLALGLRLSMMKFVRSVLIFYRIAPSQLSAVAWHTVIGFEALRDLYALEACLCEVFNTTYSLRKTTYNARYFAPQSGVEKIIVNMVTNDHGMRDTVVRVTGPCDVESEGERGAVPVIWNLDSGPHGGILPTTDIKVKLRKLVAIDFNCRNWS